MLAATNNFLVPNSTFVVELVAFLLVLGVLARYVLPVVNKAISDRQDVIRKSLEDADTATRRAKEAEEEYGRTIDKARQEARSLIDEANKSGEAARAELRQRGEAEYERIVSRAQPDIEASARRASEELRQQVAGMVMTVVQRVISEGFDTEEHRALIERTIGQVETEAQRAPEVHA